MPIEEHADLICKHVATHRITIIHGETGCGKSSMVPLLLLKSHDKAWKAQQRRGGRDLVGPARMYVTQPRRIAARSLCQRVRELCGPAEGKQSKDSGELVGYRLGHGEKSGIGRKTRIVFATTGYLVLLLAHHPEKFDKHSHLVIDEVHERSIDTDVLCLLARRLLHTNKHIKLVLMSATVAAALYQSYFGSPEEPIDDPIFVGARRFPVAISFPDDLMEANASSCQLPKAIQAKCRELVEKTKINAPRSTQVAKLQVELAVTLARMTGRVGSSVLIFVSGQALALKT